MQRYNFFTTFTSIMMTNLFQAIFATLFPPICNVCGSKLFDGEEYICDDCKSEIPLTYNWNNINNIVYERVKSHVDICSAVSFFHYETNDNYSNIILNAKFKNQRKLAFEMGRLMGLYIQNSLSVNGLDYIIPVPLHISRRRWRGYNQSDYIAHGLGSVLGVEVLCDVVVRHKKSSVQSKVGSREKRRENVKDAFSVIDVEKLEGKRILLLDDVITSGATISSCAKAIKNSVPTTEIVVGALSSTK